MMPPCKDCPKRKLGCHDRCEEYRQFKAERQAAIDRAKADHEVSRSEFERYQTRYRRNT